MNTITNGQIFLYETLGTAMLLLLGCGVVATAILRDSKGFGGGWLLINFGWGLGVFAGVYVAFPVRRAPEPGGDGRRPADRWATITGGTVDSSTSSASSSGAFIGAVLAWVAFKQHFDLEEDAGRQARGLLHRPGHPFATAGTSSPRSSAPSC